MADQTAETLVKSSVVTDEFAPVNQAQSSEQSSAENASANTKTEEQASTPEPSKDNAAPASDLQTPSPVAIQRAVISGLAKTPGFGKIGIKDPKAQGQAQKLLALMVDTLEFVKKTDAIKQHKAFALAAVPELVERLWVFASGQVRDVYADKLKENIVRYYSCDIESRVIGVPTLPELGAPEQSIDLLNGVSRGMALINQNISPGLHGWFIDQLRDKQLSNTTLIAQALRQAKIMVDERWPTVQFMPAESKAVLELTLAAQLIKAKCLYDLVEKNHGREFAEYILGSQEDHIQRVKDLSVKAANAIDAIEEISPQNGKDVTKSVATAMGALMDQGMRPWFNHRQKSIRLAVQNKDNLQSDEVAGKVEQQRQVNMSARNTILTITLKDDFAKHTGRMAQDVRLRGDLVMAYARQDIEADPEAIETIESAIDAIAVAYSTEKHIPMDAKARSRQAMTSILRRALEGGIAIGENPTEVIRASVNVFSELSGEALPKTLEALDGITLPLSSIPQEAEAKQAGNAAKPE